MQKHIDRIRSILRRVLLPISKTHPAATGGHRLEIPYRFDCYRPSHRRRPVSRVAL